MQRHLVEEELEHYRFGWISRREFIRQAALIGVGAAAATAMAQGATPAPRARASSLAQESPFHVPVDDPSVATDWVQYPSTDGVLILGYLAWPADLRLDRSHPGVVLSDANRSLNDHARDVARRFAKQDYVALAPDLISRTGTPTADLPEDERRSAFASLDADQLAWDMAAGLEFLKAHPSVDPAKLAATGYCASGEVVWRLATLYPDLAAAAPFYGGNPPLGDVPNIRAAIFGVYGGLDTRLNAGIPDIEAAMVAAGIIYRIKVYPNSAHAFHRDDSPRSYNSETAAEAWRDTLNWFAEHLALEPPSFLQLDLKTASRSMP